MTGIGFSDNETRPFPVQELVNVSAYEFPESTQTTEKSARLRRQKSSSLNGSTINLMGTDPLDREQLLSAKLEIETRVSEIDSINEAKQEEERRRQREIEAVKQKLWTRRTEISALSILKEQIPWSENLGSEILLAAQRDKFKGRRFDLQANELLAKAKAQIEKRRSYLKLFGLVTFFCAYCYVCVLQTRTGSLGIESSLLFSSMFTSLPTSGQGSSVFNAAVSGATGVLQSNDQFYSWLNGTIQSIYSDAVCGNGVCDFPEETKGLGRFGCASDCGKVDANKIIAIRIDLATVAQQRYGAQLDHDTSAPTFSYNIYSQHFGTTLFESNMKPSADSTVVAEVLRDDQLELRFYQEGSLARVVPVDDIRALYHFSSESIPERNFSAAWPEPAFQYGNLREVAAVSKLTTEAIASYCQNSVGGVYDARINDPACKDSILPYPQGYPNYFSNLETGLQMLTSYGISGDITVFTENDYGRQIKLSLIRNGTSSNSGLPAINFCSPLQGTTVDLKDIPRGSDFVDYVNAVGAKCSARREGRGVMYRPEWRKIKGGVEQAPSNMSHRLVRKVKRSVDIWDRNPAAKAHPIRFSSRKLLSAEQAKENPLQLQLLDITIEDLGYWRCNTGPNDIDLNPKCWVSNAQSVFDSFDSSHKYGYPNPTSAAVDVLYTNIKVFQSEPRLVQMYQNYQTGSGPAPGLVDAGLSIRYSVQSDGLELAKPNCEDFYNPPKGVKASEYSFKTRLLLWNSAITNISVWICCVSSSCPEKNATYVSYLDVNQALSAENLPAPLMPGPYVTFTVVLNNLMSAAQIQAYKERLCKVVWSVLNEMCQYLAWSEQKKNEMKNVWSIKTTFVSFSNSRATRISYGISQDVLKSDFTEQFPEVNISVSESSVVTAPGPMPKLTRESDFSCVSHYDCDNGLFCSTGALRTASATFQGSGGPSISGFGCDSCKYCLSDASDPIDRYCPRDKCGDSSGTYPDCIDFAKLFKRFVCPESYKINLTKAPPPPAVSDEPDDVPLSSPNSTAKKARFVTPFNQLVGAVVISQTRMKGACLSGNDTVKSYSASKTPGLGPVCRGKTVDPAPYGADPVFLKFSTLFRGDLVASSYWDSVKECFDNTWGGFFVHSYDQVTHERKRSEFIMPEMESQFKLYFPESVSARHAVKLVQFMVDGGFIDSKTSLDSGQIKYDYSVTSVPIYLYNSPDSDARAFLEVLCVSMLILNCCIEISDIFVAVRKFRFYEYMTDLWNVIDWGSSCCMWLAWALWFHQMFLIKNINMPPSFDILNSPQDTTLANYFRTNSANEFIFLSFIQSINDAITNWTTYSVLATFNVLLFILRLMKAADFQPRIAIMTHTVFEAWSDLIHFMIIFVSVLLGFGVSGMLLFGRQNNGYATFTDASLTLMILLINWDASVWVKMSHAAPDWALNIFIWSWTIVAYFMLLNIFLAIFVDAFMKVKLHIQAADFPSIPEDIGYIIRHEGQRFLKLVYPKYPFISDELLVATLCKNQDSASAVKKHAQILFDDYYQLSRNSFLEIKCSMPGADINAKELFELMEHFFPDEILGGSDTKEVNPVVQNLMIRHGHVIKPLDSESRIKKKKQDFFEMMQLESMKQMLLNDIKTNHSNVHIGDHEHFHVSSVVLRVIVERARNIPNMDTFRGADVCCVVMLEGSQEIFQTEIRRGLDERSWSWEPELSSGFCWQLPQGSELLRPEGHVVVMVYDKDQLSSDDVIGVVKVKLEELYSARGSIDGWKKIIQPPNFRKRFLCFSVKKEPELKLKISLSCLPQDIDPEDPPGPLADSPTVSIRYDNKGSNRTPAGKGALRFREILGNIAAADMAIKAASSASLVAQSETTQLSSPPSSPVSPVPAVQRHPANLPPYLL